MPADWLEGTIARAASYAGSGVGEPALVLGQAAEVQAGEEDERRRAARFDDGLQLRACLVGLAQPPGEPAQAQVRLDAAGVGGEGAPRRVARLPEAVARLLPGLPLRAQVARRRVGERLGECVPARDGCHERSLHLLDRCDGEEHRRRVGHDLERAVAPVEGRSPAHLDVVDGHGRLQKPAHERGVARVVAHHLDVLDGGRLREPGRASRAPVSERGVGVEHEAGAHGKPVPGFGCGAAVAGSAELANGGETADLVPQSALGPRRDLGQRGVALAGGVAREQHDVGG